MENNQIQVDIKYAYETTLEIAIQKEKEIIGLKALCNQLANQLHEALHKIEELEKREELEKGR